MPRGSNTKPNAIVGIIGFGAFGQLIARDIQPYFRLCAYDPAPGLQPVAERYGVTLTSLEMAASCPVVVLAMPVGRLQEVVEAVAPYIRPGSLVLDVGSVKVGPAQVMRRGLPEGCVPGRGVGGRARSLRRSAARGRWPEAVIAGLR